MGREVWLLVRPDGVAVERLICDPDMPAEAPAGLAWMRDDGRVVVPRDAGVASRSLAPLEFRRRFTAAERGAITLAASRGLEAGDPTLQVWLDDLNSATALSLDSPELRGALDAMVAGGLLAPERIAELLA